MYGISAQPGWAACEPQAAPSIDDGSIALPLKTLAGSKAVGVKRTLECAELQSCSSEESFFAFGNDQLAPRAHPDSSLHLAGSLEETEDVFSEECTGGLRDDSAESISAAYPAAAAAAAAAAAGAAQGADPFMVPELMDMLRLALDREAELSLQPNYLRLHDETVQPEHYINAEMRKLTVGWMGEVVREYGLSQETLFLACGLFDRFLSCSTKVPRICLQLVAVACVQIAAKSEEVVYPSVKSFTYIAGNAFSPADLVRTETLVLRCLGWRIQLPTAHAFLSLFKHALGMRPQSVALACYMLELSQLEYSMLAYRPSQMAAAASLLATMYHGHPADLRALAKASCSSLFELKGCLELMLVLQKGALLAPPATPSAVVREEYRSPKWLGAACVTPFECVPLSIRITPLGPDC